jgi:hypothetical protein
MAVIDQSSWVTITEKPQKMLHDNLQSTENVIKLPTDITAEVITPAKHLVSCLIFSLKAGYPNQSLHCVPQSLQILTQYNKNKLQNISFTINTNLPFITTLPTALCKTGNSKTAVKQSKETEQSKHINQKPRVQFSPQKN